MTLIQTKKIASFPVVLIGTEYWRPLHDLLQHLAASGTIGAGDLDLLLVTDSVNEALQHIDRHTVQQFGLTRRRLRPSTLLGERRVALARAVASQMPTSRHQDGCA